MKGLDWLFSRKAAPLTGAPAVRRQKAYSAASGYVYQYYYEGQRAAERQGSSGSEFVFDISADRKTSALLSVFVSEEALELWQQEHGRALTSTERYAIAKMALFQAFDERPDPASMKEEVRVRPADVAGFLCTLDID